MLRIIQQQSASAAKSYYSQADYLSEGQELTGRWGGKSSSLLGLSGNVSKQHFDALCDNVDPRSGQRLTLRNKSNRTVGYDFNWHVPKSVSLAYSLNHDRRILQVLEDSVNATMQDVEADSSTRVRKHNQMEERKTENLVWATFVHTTTRPIDGEADPHLHAHCFTFNTTWDDVEESWKAVQFRDLKRDAPYYEAVFKARVAKGLKDLGYVIERTTKGWDTRGLERETIEKFSRRTLEIEKLASELGIEDDHTKDSLGAKTRASKDSSLPLGELEKRWRLRLTPKEISDLQSLLSHSESNADSKQQREIDATLLAKTHCFERDSVVPERKLVAEALKFGIGDVTVEGIRRQLSSQGIISRELHGRTWVTTPEVLAEETSMLNVARRGLKSAKAINPEWKIKRDMLNQDQRNAVMHVLTSKDKVMMIRGGAGTGKTTLMREAVEGIEQQGKKVFTFAPSAEASRGVLVSEGFDATTVAELLLSTKLQGDVKDNVIWIDEAGLLGTRVLKQVIDLAEHQNARLILSGDWKQHGSVERGAGLRLLEQEGGIEPAIVRKIQRQDGDYREAVAALAEGDVVEGFKKLQDLKWVHEIEDADTRYQAMAASFANGIEAGEKVLAVTPTHAEAELLTTKIREEMKSRALILGSDRVIQQLKPMYLTEAERQDSYAVAQGDVMVFHRGDKNVKKGDRLEANVENATRFRKKASQFEVYRSSSFSVAKGDLIRITQNGKTKDGMQSLNNGQVFKVKGFNKAGDLVLNNNWVLDQNYGFIAPGYVSTSHSSQGKTVDRVLIAESQLSYVAADQSQFYVSVSRGQKRAEIYTDDENGLIEAVSKQYQRVSATELVHKQVIPRVKKQRRNELVKEKTDMSQDRSWQVAYERV